MSIIFHESSKEFHLYNDEISYIIKILRNGQPGDVYKRQGIYGAERRYSSGGIF